MRLYCVVLGMLLAQLTLSGMEARAEELVVLTSSDGVRQVTITLSAPPGSDERKWCLNSSLEHVLLTQGLPDGADIDDDGVLRALYFRDSRIRFGRTGRVVAWLPDKAFRLRRVGSATWSRRDSFRATAADVMDAIGAPEWDPEQPLRWQYGASFFEFDKHGRVVHSHNAGELVWTPGHRRHLVRRLDEHQAKARMEKIEAARRRRKERLTKVLEALGKVAEAYSKSRQPATEKSAKPDRNTQPRTVALLCVSGFPLLGRHYLKRSAGPHLKKEIERMGHHCAVAYFANEEAEYQALLWALRRAHAARADIVLLAHSQGGVWAHAAARDLPGVSIKALIDLDTSSYGWIWRKTPTIGDPRSAYLGRDLEDVVFANTEHNLEIRSESALLPKGERYDEAPNVRYPSGSRRGITTIVSHTPHGEVHQPGGPSIAQVERWLREILAER